MMPLFAVNVQQRLHLFLMVHAECAMHKGMHVTYVLQVTCYKLHVTSYMHVT